jgi:hypothetical protein
MYCGCQRSWKSTISLTPARSAAAMIVLASSTSVVNGFSTRTCLPASIMARQGAVWARSGVAMPTASTSLAATSAISVVHLQPTFSARRRARSGFRSQT